MGAPPPVPPSAKDALTRFADRLAWATNEMPAGEGVAIVVAHPDDETIGLGGHLRHLRNCTIVHVTDGAPRDGRDAAANGFTTPLQYATARRRELEAAMAEAGIGREQLVALGIPDGQAVDRLSAIAIRLADLFAARNIQLVLTHALEGGHPDHDGSAVAVWAACRRQQRRGQPAPDVLEMPFYHAGPAGPVFQTFLPHPLRPEVRLDLDSDEQELKRRMLGKFVTQRDTLAQFTSTTERFRAAGTPDLSALPNNGQLQYERWGLGTGAEWLQAARKGLAELGIEQE